MAILSRGQGVQCIHGQPPYCFELAQAAKYGCWQIDIAHGKLATKTITASSKLDVSNISL